jgi:hypothetical protein
MSAVRKKLFSGPRHHTETSFENPNPNWTARGLVQSKILPRLQNARGKNP